MSFGIWTFSYNGVSMFSAPTPRSLSFPFLKPWAFHSGFLAHPLHSLNAIDPFWWPLWFQCELFLICSCVWCLDSGFPAAGPVLDSNDIFTHWRLTDGTVSLGLWWRLVLQPDNSSPLLLVCSLVPDGRNVASCLMLWLSLLHHHVFLLKLEDWITLSSLKFLLIRSCPTSFGV